jgi:hypothetical protein
MAKRRYHTDNKSLAYHYVGIMEQLEDDVKEVVFNATLSENHLLFSAKNGKYFIAGRELDPEHLEEWGSLILAEVAKKLLKK